MPKQLLSLAAMVWAAPALWLGAGCRPAEPLRRALPPPVLGGAPLTPLERIPRNKDPRDFLLLARLQLTTVQLPLGSVSDSAELWSYVNEEPVAARIGSAIARNGIRVGLGRAHDWKDVERLLRRLAGHALGRGLVMPAPGVPMPWLLKGNQDWQTFFIYRPDRTLVGYDYEPGDNVLMLGAALDYDDLASVILMGAPVVRSASHRQQYTTEMDRYVLKTEPVHYVLPDMDFRFTVPAGGFVLIGPGPDVRRANSPGYRFLEQDRSGLKYEPILVVWPEAFFAPLVESK
jgi:hypothetical protein